MRFSHWFRELSVLRRIGVMGNIALIAASLVMAVEHLWWLGGVDAVVGPGYSLWLIRKFQRQEREEAERQRGAQEFLATELDRERPASFAEALERYDRETETIQRRTEAHRSGVDRETR